MIRIRQLTCGPINSRPDVRLSLTEIHTRFCDPVHVLLMTSDLLPEICQLFNLSPNGCCLRPDGLLEDTLQGVVGPLEPILCGSDPTPVLGVLHYQLTQEVTVVKAGCPESLVAGM